MKNNTKIEASILNGPENLRKIGIKNKLLILDLS